MLAFGYATFSPDSGDMMNRADAHFVVSDSDDNLLRIHRKHGHVERFHSDTDSDDADEPALQLAQDVEDAWGALGQRELPLRIVELADTVTTAGLVNAFVVAYYQSNGDTDGTDSDPTEFVNLLADTRTTGSDEPVTDRQRLPELAGAEKYMTPAGDAYLPRQIGGYTDVLVLRQALDMGMTVGLEGEPGSGKTTLAQVAAPKLIQHVFHGESSADEILGSFIPDPSSPTGYGWQDGPLLMAMRGGLPFLADELPRAPREVQALFFPVCDHRRSITSLGNPHIGELVAAPGFAVIIAFNPDSGFGMDEALFDRIAFTITVPTDLNAARELGVPAEFVAAAKALRTDNAAANRRGGAPVWVPTLRSLLKARDIADAFGLQFAASALVSACPDEMMRPAVAKRLEKALKLRAGELSQLVALS